MTIERSKPSQSLKKPKQTRSLTTLNRIMQAASRLMAEGTFDKASINDIVKRAGTSVGAFYTRFKNKEALFQLIQQRFFAEADMLMADVVFFLASHVVHLGDLFWLNRFPYVDSFSDQIIQLGLSCGLR